MKMAIPWFKSNQPKSGRVGIAVGPDGISVAQVDDAGGLTFHQSYDLPDALDDFFVELVEQHDWQQQPCSLVIHPAYYQLLLTDSPSVEADETHQALSWKVKELLEFPVDQAVIDYFALPDDAYRGRQKMVYVAALQKAQLQRLAEPLETSGLMLDCIEVAELAINNLAARHQHERGAFAVLQLFAAEGFINMVEDGSLYLSRRFDLGSDEFFSGHDPQAFLNNLLLEIQRSIDYFESQLGKGIVTHLYYLPFGEIYQAIGDFLSEQLGVHVAAMPMSAMAGSAEGDQLGRSALAFGAALGPYDEQGADSATH